MNEIDSVLVFEKLEQISADLRRLGRASVASQAASEACLAGLERLQSEWTAEPGRSKDGEREAEIEAARERAADTVILALLPVADALDRITSDLERSTDLQAAVPTRRWPWSLFLKPRSDVRFQSLAQGVRLLQLAFAQSFEHLGVEIERRSGGPIDPERHRVREVRAPRTGEAPRVVAKVLRAGYVRGGRVLREADVVVAPGNSDSLDRSA